MSAQPPFTIHPLIELVRSKARQFILAHPNAGEPNALFVGAGKAKEFAEQVVDAMKHSGMEDGGEPPTPEELMHCWSKPDDAEKHGKFQLCGLTVLIVKGDDVEVGRSTNVVKYPRPDEIHPFPEFFYEQD